MNLSRIVKRSARFIVKHLPDILLGVSLTSTAAGAYFTYKATSKIQHKLDTEGACDKKEAIKAYIPAAVCYAISGATSFAGHRINVVRLRQANAQYTSLLSEYTKYAAGVAAAVGGEIDGKVRAQMAHDKIKDLPPWVNTNLEREEFDIYDPVTRQTTRATLTDISDMASEFNRVLNRDGFVSLEQYCKLFGLPGTFVDDTGCVNETKHSDLMWDAGELWDWYGESWVDIRPVEHKEADGAMWYSLQLSQWPTIDGSIDFDAPATWDEYDLAKTTSPWMKGGNPDVQ